MERHTSWRTIRTESGSAVLLVVVAAVALLWANSPLSEAYFGLWDVEIGFDVGGFGLHMNLHHWINDGSWWSSSSSLASRCDRNSRMGRSETPAARVSR